ncbi:NADP-dependent oxidoreductase domain-containing protein [Cerioporus squamosus]|nr:NADP-dependent oxidoreductase domain-containing protein [Cerioporus squamosus]
MTLIRSPGVQSHRFRSHVLQPTTTELKLAKPSAKAGFLSESPYQSTALAAVDDSLKNFGFDYLNLMLIHCAKSSKQLRLDTWRALIEAKRQGKLQSIGVSNYGVNHLEEIREAGLETPDINQIESQPLSQQKEIVQYCKKHGIVNEAYAPLMRTRCNDPEILDTAKKYDKGRHKSLCGGPFNTVYDFQLSDEDMARIDALDPGKGCAFTWNPVDADKPPGRDSQVYKYSGTQSEPSYMMSNVFFACLFNPLLSELPPYHFVLRSHPIHQRFRRVRQVYDD